MYLQSSEKEKNRNNNNTRYKKKRIKQKNESSPEKKNKNNYDNNSNNKKKEKMNRISENTRNTKSHRCRQSYRSVLTDVGTLMQVLANWGTERGRLVGERLRICNYVHNVSCGMLDASNCTGNTSRLVC